jgi:hypothetical protein
MRGSRPECALGMTCTRDDRRPTQWGGYSCARPPGAARHGNSPEPPALPADGPPRMPAVVDAASTSRTVPRASRISGGVAYPAMFASPSKYPAPDDSEAKSHGGDSELNRSFRPCDFEPKRTKTARNGAKRAETASKRKRSPPGVGDNLQTRAMRLTCDRAHTRGAPRNRPSPRPCAPTRTGSDNIDRRIQSKTEQKPCPTPRPRYTRRVDRSASSPSKGVSWANAPRRYRASAPPQRTDAVVIPPPHTALQAGIPQGLGESG